MAYLYVATTDGGLLLGSGVLFADSYAEAFMQARHLYGILANIQVRRYDADDTDEGQEAQA